jgi:hypothetical protein
MFHTVEKARWWATIGRSIAQYGPGMLIVSSPTATQFSRAFEKQAESSQTGSG